MAAGDSPGKTCRIRGGRRTARCSPNSLAVFQPLETELVREISNIYETWGEDRQLNPKSKFPETAQAR